MAADALSTQLRRPAQGTRRIYALLRILIAGFMRLFFRIRAFGLEHVPLTGPVILASNHQSFLDPILVAVLVRREVHFMARDTLFKGRIFKPLIEFLNAFPVRRGMADIGAVKAILRRLEQGACVTAFPEATRSADGRVNECRGGILVVAQRAGVPIVPVALEGAFEAWPRTRKLPRPARIWVQYGPALMPERLANLDSEAGAALITDEIRRLHNQLRRRMGRPPFEYAPDRHPAPS